MWEQVFNYGIEIAGRHYEFLCFSASQLREAQAYFFATRGDDLLDDRPLTPLHSITNNNNNNNNSNNNNNNHSNSTTNNHSNSSYTPNNININSQQQNHQQHEIILIIDDEDNQNDDKNNNNTNNNKNPDPKTSSPMKILSPSLSSASMNTKPTRRGKIEIEEVRNWLGDFSKEKNLAKFAARLGQTLSKTTPTIIVSNMNNLPYLILFNIR